MALLTIKRCQKS